MSANYGAGAAVKRIQKSKEPKPMIGKAPKQMRVPDKPSKPIHKKLSPAMLTMEVY